MKRKTIFSIFFGLLAILTLYFFVQLIGNFASVREIDSAKNHLLNYQIVVWVSWVVMVILAVIYKWSEKKDLFFNLLYGYLIAAWVFFAVFAQKLVYKFEIATGFEDGYTYGVLVALEHNAISAVLTGILQAGVWWFTRKWHRR